ncbi:MAG: methyltransferase [Actinomycetota bacterium]
MGLRTWLLEIPIVYDLLQNGLNRSETRTWFSDQVICATDGMRILDVGCGTATILSLLPNIEYIGIDHNPKYIAKARLIHRDRGEFRSVDVNDAQFRKLGQFDRVLLLGVLHHLNDGECIKLFSALRQASKEDGQLVTLDPALVSGQHPIARALAKLDRGRYARTPQQYQSLIETSFVVTSEIIRHDLLRVPYTHVALRAGTR